MWIKDNIKNLYRVKELPEDRNGVYRMDRNERTWEFSEDFLQLVREHISSETLTNYPELDDVYNELSKFLAVKKENIFLHTGSDLVIKSIFETYISENDIILLHSPSYAMYSVYANMFGAKLYVQQFDNNLNFDIDKYCSNIVKHKPKLVVLENPNGFIGNSFNLEQIIKVVETAYACSSLIIIDEAYIDFVNSSVISKINEYYNLIIVRTMSKAWGIAGLRMGYAVSNAHIIDEIMKTKPMHEITGFTADVVRLLLSEKQIIREYVDAVKNSRDYFISEMRKRNIKTADSRANFVAVRFGEVADCDKLRLFMHERKFYLRRAFREKELREWVRVGLLPIEQMKEFVMILDEFLKYNKMKGLES